MLSFNYKAWMNDTVWESVRRLMALRNNDDNNVNEQL